MVYIVREKSLDGAVVIGVQSLVSGRKIHKKHQRTRPLRRDAIRKDTTMKTPSATTPRPESSSAASEPDLATQLTSATADETDEALAEDTLGNLPLPPEIVAPRLALLETWDESMHGSGFRVEPEPAEDESEFPEVLAEEGVDEAEEEMRALQETEEEKLEREEEEEEGE